ncbi:MAG: iron-sulfur cluster assembly scaffold protein, partial [Nitrososphaerota archaeon]
MSSPELDEILDHYRNPRNYGEIENPDIHAKDSNPLCGDVV